MNRKSIKSEKNVILKAYRRKGNEIRLIELKSTKTEGFYQTDFDLVSNIGGCINHYDDFIDWAIDCNYWLKSKEREKKINSILK